MTIDDPAHARRLARAICSDVGLYNGEAVRAAPQAARAGILQEPIFEARELYVSRVVPELLPIFDEEMMQLCERLEVGPIALDAPRPERERPMPASHAHPPVPRVERSDEPEPVGGGGGGLVLAIVALLLAALAGVAGWFLLQR